MAGPFLPPQVVLDGFKERPEALAIHGDKFYVGTSTGTVQMYTLGDGQDGSGNPELTKTITVSKKPIEQLGYLKDVNSLVVLSGKSRLLLHYTHLRSAHLTDGKAPSNTGPNNRDLSRRRMQKKARDLFVEGW